MSLFQFGEFTLASGKVSRFKLECEAISPEEWHSLARIACPILPPFDYVIPVPRGGNAWASIFQHYVSPGAGRVLFVDDVYTTGTSMAREVVLHSLDKPFNKYDSVRWHGLVLFARGPVPENVTALFTLNGKLQ